jgi:hypothetical protein
MIPDFETLEGLARRARAERSLYIAELIATAVIAIDQFASVSWERAVAFLRTRPANVREAVTARR